MNDYILLMHDDAPCAANAADEHSWAHYFAMLFSSGHFEDGCAIGDGACFSKFGAANRNPSQLTGFIKVKANSLQEAQSLLCGNPVYEAGGTVEIHELPQSH